MWYNRNVITGHVQAVQYCDRKYSLLSDDWHGRPQEFLQGEEKLAPFPLHPSSLSPFTLTPIPPLSFFCPLPIALPFPLEATPLNLDRGVLEHCSLPQRGLGQSPGRSRTLVYFEHMNVFCGNDFCFFCEKQNVVIEAKFQGRASTASCPYLRAGAVLEKNIWGAWPP